MKTKNIAALAVLAIAIMATSAFAFGMGRNGDASVEQALENQDYAAWQTAVQANEHSAFMAQIVDENEFPLLVQHHNEMEAQRELRMKNGGDMREAMNAGDYDAWYDAAVNMGRNPDDILSEDDFNTLAEIHEERSGKGFGRGRMAFH